mgnify:FL=1
MEDFILDILARVRELERALTANELEDIVRAHNQGIRENQSHISKRRALPFFLKVRESDPQRWASWNISTNEDALLLQTLRMKPRRTASGVATITVITKPWLCSGACIYCPNDVRMPKSYLHNEPACQRAERNCFDPYLQVSSRLRALESMGHVTDKIELIVLGGTWNDYPEGYRIWFVRELFRALNDAEESDAKRADNEREKTPAIVPLDNPLTQRGEVGDENDHDRIDAVIDSANRPIATRAFAHQNEAERRAFYDEAGISHDPDTLARACAKAQQRIYEGSESHAQAIRELYGENHAWQHVSAMQTATLDDVFREHERNVNAAHRNVGLVIETRPDSIDCESLTLMRALGCTKIQMGVQSLDEHVLEANKRHTSPEQIAQAFALCRLFGFKSHAHFMANLLGATPNGDASDFRTLVSDTRFLPDEVKMYPCALIGGTGLMAHYADGTWRPYNERELVGVLADNVLATPPFTRISRMIRDFSSGDIVDGNKKVNLREVVEAQADRLAAQNGTPIQEIRHRELAGAQTEIGELSLIDYEYETSNTREHFLQWVTPENRIAGFLRLSLPCQHEVEKLQETEGAFPIEAGQAMIREVHVYGKVAQLHGEEQNAQHRGLGKALVERACEIAVEAGYRTINVISAIGTRGYYARLGFEQAELYQQRTLR